MARQSPSFDMSGGADDFNSGVTNALPVLSTAANYFGSLNAQKSADTANALQYSLAQQNLLRQERVDANNYALALLNNDRENRKQELDQFLQMQQAFSNARVQDYQAATAELMGKVQQMDLRNKLGYGLALAQLKTPLYTLDALYSTDVVAATAQRTAFEQGNGEVFAAMDPVQRAEYITRWNDTETRLIMPNPNGGSWSLADAKAALKSGGIAAKADALAAMAMQSRKSTADVAAQFGVTDSTVLALAANTQRDMGGNLDNAIRVAAARKLRKDFNDETLAPLSGSLDLELLQQRGQDITNLASIKLAEVQRAILPGTTPEVRRTILSSWAKGNQVEAAARGSEKNSKLSKYTASGIDLAEAGNLLSPADYTAVIRSGVPAENMAEFDKASQQATLAWAAALKTGSPGDRSEYVAKMGDSMTQMYRLAGRADLPNTTDMIPPRLVAGMKTKVQEAVDNLRGTDIYKAGVSAGLRAELDKAGMELWAGSDGKIGGASPIGATAPGMDRASTLLANEARRATDRYSWWDEVDASKDRKGHVSDVNAARLREYRAGVESLGLFESTAQTRAQALSEVVALANTVSTYGLTPEEAAKDTPPARFMGAGGPFPVRSEAKRIPGYIAGISRNLQAYARHGGMDARELGVAQDMLAKLNATSWATKAMTGMPEGRNKFTLAHFAPDAFWTSSFPDSSAGDAIDAGFTDWLTSLNTSRAYPVTGALQQASGVAAPAVNPAVKYDALIGGKVYPLMGAEVIQKGYVKPDGSLDSRVTSITPTK